jgi:hypothetical protein
VVKNNELYVGRYYPPVIEVYDIATFSSRRNLSISGLHCASDMTSCPQCDFVYVSDGCNNKIYVSDERGYEFNWFVAEKPEGLSMDSQMNVVVTFTDSRTLRVFTPRGELVRNVILPPDISYPRHAVQLNDNRYAVVHGSLPDDLHRVCIVNGHGTLIERYGGSLGSGIGLLNRPLRMLAFGGSLIVTDSNNYRLLLLNASPLEYKRHLMSTDSESLMPRRLAISEDGTRLFVSYSSSHLRIMNLTWI